MSTAPECLHAAHRFGFSGFFRHSSKKLMALSLDALLAPPPVPHTQTFLPPHPALGALLSPYTLVFRIVPPGFNDNLYGTLPKSLWQPQYLKCSIHLLGRESAPSIHLEPSHSLYPRRNSFISLFSHLLTPVRHPMSLSLFL